MRYIQSRSWHDASIVHSFQHLEKRDLTLEPTSGCKLRNEMVMNGLMQIGDVATRTGLTVDAIRFYERERLLHTTARSSGGFRLFSIGDVEDLTFIRNAQELGFSLDEIRELLGLKHASHPDCAQVEQLLERKIGIVRRKIGALRKLERELRRAATDCRLNLGRVANRPAENCPVLAEISHPKGGKK